ncbi:ATP-binding protein [Cesiribacter andamanensis]|uniref:ATP-binding protein n=1 Tax=Cesiribacter andamanensis TaxID=649507 RepID=UPI00034D7614|nr:tetratricopeptide repeat-containing sensor histidine kinase [Cesiribacter andamanensis]
MTDSIKSLNVLARRQLDRAPDQAYTLGRQALELSQQIGYKPGMAEAMRSLGVYYQDQAKYATALQYITDARKLYGELQDTLMMARTIRQLGGLYQQRALYAEAEHYYQEALSIALRKNYRLVIGRSLKDLGGLSYFLREYPAAIVYFERSLHYINKEEDPASYAAVLNNLGVVNKAQKKYPAALAYLKQAYTLLEQQQSVRDLSVVLMNIGEAQQKMGLVDEAEQNFLKALKAAQRVQNVQRQVEAYQYLADFYAEGEDFAKAYRYKKEYAAYKDTLYRQEAQAQMAEMAKKLELERKERAFSELIQGKEMELLSKEFEISQLELYRKNNLVIVFVLLVSTAMGISFILYKSYQTKRRQNRQLADQNQEIIQKNLLLEEMNQKLLASQRELKELNETKDKFFSILAHDLRSPLVTLKSFVSLLHSGHSKFSEAEMHRLTGRIERSLQGLTSLLDNLLQWSSAQSGLITFAPRTLDLQKVVDENLLLLESTALAKEIRLQTDCQAQQVTADRHMLNLVLRNLLGNALKFTRRGGNVYLRTRETETHTLIQVEDTGIGIRPELLGRLLEDKSLRSSWGTENEKGSGLGLMLCKEFIERHQGSLEISSEEEKGTCFTVRLPKASQPAPKVVQRVAV